MKEIVKQDVQTIIDRYATKNVYLHLETTNGAYASHFDQSFFSASAIYEMLRFRTSKERFKDKDRIALV
ncbi:hypothetical protein JCM19038_2460 [Geomicrobium sp. JCM 19038]|nr:hypothetical protein JCM19038_2460 [Geomicrobium sp. JCM 19038]